MTNKLIVIIILIVVIIGGGAFYGGMKYVENNSPVGGQHYSNQGDFQNMQNLSPQERQQRLQEMSGNAGGISLRQGFGGQGFTVGEIIAKDDKSITVKLGDGGSRIIFFSDVTEITKSAKASMNDINVGAEIRVNGSQNTDGSVTAQSIQLVSQAK